MSYIEEFEKELIGKLDGQEDTAAIVRWISEKVLESYRNGITAGQKGTQVHRQGQSRRRARNDNHTSGVTTITHPWSGEACGLT